ncbi:2-nitropropane dioxygenase NPD [Catenulispora acidiphila DSM 44928]|uniref:2-nitropropane dioxygenase NPD n=1 Tax=Catenulispora acidiphila (strain DSM 44928 / JCM 14897 / NBRC 102108 / NRRL B-24433 / ID139908) TaxID=479433 RepID=C7Q4M8_CATAD|nr:nitronate monooxygenase family protein [Catenulispora acidiphila]ACU71997.1 2-nitropropane dioxygenase NPD [Catenulispora acidiphila DSM 44928]
MRTPLSASLGLEFPLFAFSHCRDVVAAVTRAGGLGVLGAVYFTPDELETELRWLDAHTDGKPYGVDVVMPASVSTSVNEVSAKDSARTSMEETLKSYIPAKHRDFVEGILDKYEVPELPADGDHSHQLLGWTDATARPQVEVALDHPIALLASALGPLPADIVELAHRKNVRTAGLASSAHHARKQVECGVDIIVAQGTEAGGHTGEISTMVLIPEVVDAVGDTPVLAAGGIGNGRQVAAAMALGAQGAWTGSIWLTVAEADTDPRVVPKLLAASSRDTVRSRALTGKPARQLRTDWIDAWESEDSPGALPMPLQYMLVSEAHRRISRAGRTELMGMPVGQIVGSMTDVRPVREVIYQLVEEYAAAVERLGAITEA